MRDDDRTVRFIGLNLFIFFSSIYLLTYSGPSGVDANRMRMEVARSIVERFDAALPLGTGILRGIDGRDYSTFGIGSVLMALPVYIIGKFSGISPENLFDLIVLLIGVATVVLVFLFSISLGYSNRTAVFTAIFYGLGTMAWRFSKDSQDHGIETFFVLLSVYYMSRHVMSKQVMHLIYSAFFLGTAFITRPNAVLVMPSLYVMMIYYYVKEYDFKTRLRLATRNIAIFSLSFLPFMGIILFYNYDRFGSVFESGFGLMAKRLGIDFFTGTPLMIGLAGFLVSPGQGFFYYTPIAILFFFSIRSFSKKYPAHTLCFILLMTAYLLFYSKNIFWHGDSTWGPRYLFAITPFFIIPAAELFDSQIRAKINIKLLVSTLFAISLVVQFAGISVHSTAYWRYLANEEHVKLEKVSGDGVQSIVYPPSECYFDWHMSSILIQFKLVHRMIGDLIENTHAHPFKGTLTAETNKPEPGMYVFDFWWVYLYFIEGSYSGFIAALLILFISVFSAARIWKAVS